MTQEKSIGMPNAFLRKRIHSLTGLFLILFLIEHLFTNSQAALWIGDDGVGFIAAVNWLHSIPYLQVVETVFLLVPFLIHGIWGIRSIQEAKINSYKTDGSRPSLEMYLKNHAFTWQRITAIIVLVGVLIHVIDLRFLRYPETHGSGLHKFYSIKTEPDSGLLSVASRLDATVVTPDTKPQLLQSKGYSQAKLEVIQTLQPTDTSWYVISDSFGTTTLFNVRDLFRSPTICFWYTLFVVAMIFHAGNGLWTGMITWGAATHEPSRRFFRLVSYVLMTTLLILGLASIWLTYFVTLAK